MDADGVVVLDSFPLLIVEFSVAPIGKRRFEGGCESEVMDRRPDIRKRIGHIRIVLFGERVGDDARDAMLCEIADDRYGILEINGNRLIDRHPCYHIAQYVDFHDRRIWHRFGKRFCNSTLAGVDGAVKENDHGLLNNFLLATDNLQCLRISERHDGEL